MRRISRDMSPATNIPALTVDDVDRIVDALERRLAEISQGGIPEGDPHWARPGLSIREHIRALEVLLAKFE